MIYNMTEKQAVFKELQEIPGIGKSLSEDLWKLGIRRISDLKGKDPRSLYHTLNTITGVKNDPCVLYTFRCAVYYATASCPEPEKLKWWYWKDKSCCESK